MRKTSLLHMILFRYFHFQVSPSNTSQNDLPLIQQCGTQVWSKLISRLTLTARVTGSAIELLATSPRRPARRTRVSSAVFVLVALALVPSSHGQVFAVRSWGELVSAVASARSFANVTVTAHLVSNGTAAAVPAGARVTISGSPAGCGRAYGGGLATGTACTIDARALGEPVKDPSQARRQLLVPSL